MKVAAFKAFHHNQPQFLTPELQLVWICDNLHITYTQLLKEPAWWVRTYMAYLAGKQQSEKLDTKAKPQPTPPPRRR